MPTIQFLPGGQRIDVTSETSILEAAHLARVPAVECCGVLPACGECRAAIVDGLEHVGPPDDLEQSVRSARSFLPFERLACMAFAAGDLTVEMEPS